MARDPDGTDAPAPTPDPTEAPAEAATRTEAQTATDAAAPEEVAAPPETTTTSLSSDEPRDVSVAADPAAVGTPAEDAGATTGGSAGPQSADPVKSSVPAAAAEPASRLVVEPDDAPAEANKPTSPASDDLEVVDTADGDGGDDDGGDDDDEDLDSDGEPKHGGNLLTKQVNVEAWHVLVGVAIVALLVGAYVIGTAQGREAGEKATSPTATTVAGSVAPPKDFVPFEDKEIGVKMSVPASWEPRSTVNLDPTARMIRAVPGSNDLMMMRVNSYAQEVTAANLGDQKAVFDAALADQPIRLLVNEAVPTGLKLPTLVYVYQFTDEQTGVVGVHSRYVFFQGRKVVTILFQAMPEDHYKALGPIWDSIINSLEVAPGPPPAFAEKAGSPGSTAPGAPTDPAAPTTAAPPTTG